MEARSFAAGYALFKRSSGARVEIRRLRSETHPVSIPWHCCRPEAPLGFEGYLLAWGVFVSGLVYLAQGAGRGVLQYPAAR